MKSQKVSPLNYAFAIGKIRALEKFLIKQEVFSEATDSNIEEALRLFVESDLYNEELIHIKDSQQLETILNQELIKLKKLTSDLLLDKELLGLIELNRPEDALAIIKGYHSGFLSNYFMHLIDMHNIKTFLRLYVLKEPEEKLRNILTCEGFIKKETFLKCYDTDLMVFLNRLEYVQKHNQIIDYTAYLKEAMKSLEKDNSFVLLEKAINDFLMQVLRPAKYLTFGPEPILAYYFAKVNEIKLIRLIILSKLNNVSSSLVKARLNLVYA